MHSIGMDGWLMEGWTDGQMDGQMDIILRVQINVNIFNIVIWHKNRTISTKLSFISPPQ